MDDLVTWLRAALDEDERVAWSAAPGPWAYQDVDSVGGGRVCDPTVSIADLHYEQPGQVDPRIRRTVLSEEADGTGAHIVRHAPTRVLAEVEAKRRIILAVGDYQAKIDGEWGCCHEAEAILAGQCPDTVVDEIPALRLLALPYADMPGFREEWRP